MTSTELTVKSQGELLEIDIHENISQIFDSMEPISSNVSLGNALVDTSKSIIVFKRDAHGGVEVSDGDAYVKASEQSQAMKYVADEIESTLAPYAERLYKLHRAVTSYMTKILQPLNAEILRLKKEREAFFAEEERLRREATLKAQEEARKAEEARLLAEAEAAQADGDTATAQAIFEEAITVEAPPVVLQSTIPTVAGTSFRTVNKFEVLDPTKLNPEFIKVDEVAIGKVVRSMKKAAETLCGKPGAIRVWEEKSIIG